MACRIGLRSLPSAIFHNVAHAAQSTLLLRSWALNPVLMRQLFQQLNSNVTQAVKAVYTRVAVIPLLTPSLSMRASGCRASLWTSVGL